MLTKPLVECLVDVDIRRLIASSLNGPVLIAAGHGLWMRGFLIGFFFTRTGIGRPVRIEIALRRPFDSSFEFVN